MIVDHDTKQEHCKYINLRKIWRLQWKSDALCKIAMSEPHLYCVIIEPDV